MVGAGGHQNFWVAPDECLPNVACPDLTDTPTLDWNPAAGAGSYLVCLALDPDFTNIVKTYRTQYTQLTPRESLLDNQAGQAYYWLVRPCKTPPGFGPLDGSVYPDAHAFRKRSRPISLESPSNEATVPDQVTFHWQDFLKRNQSSSPPVTQEARQYRIQVSTVADFAKIMDDKIVDQTTYTPFDKTYPEGQLYWRVAAIDGSSNLLLLVGLLVAIARPDLVSKLVVIGTSFDTKGMVFDVDDMVAGMSHDSFEMTMMRETYSAVSPDGADHCPPSSRRSPPCGRESRTSRSMT